MMMIIILSNASFHVVHSSGVDDACSLYYPMGLEPFVSFDEEYSAKLRLKF